MTPGDDGWRGTWHLDPVPATDDEIAAALRLAGLDLAPERVATAAILARAMQEAARRLEALDLHEPPCGPEALPP